MNYDFDILPSHIYTHIYTQYLTQIRSVFIIFHNYVLAYVFILIFKRMLYKNRYIYTFNDFILVFNMKYLIIFKKNKTQVFFVKVF